jgi:hypothetical protein
LDRAIEQLRDRDGLKVFQRLAGRTLVAVDGTEYFCSQKLSCPQCLTPERGNGKSEQYHAIRQHVLWLRGAGPGSSDLYSSGPITAFKTIVPSLPAQGAKV